MGSRQDRGLIRRPADANLVTDFWAKEIASISELRHQRQGSIQPECNACHFAYIYEIFNTCWEAVVSGRSRSHCQLFWAQQQHGRCAFGERSGPAQERTTIAGTEHHSAPDVFLHDSLYKRALADETCNEGV